LPVCTFQNRQIFHSNSCHEFKRLTSECAKSLALQTIKFRLD
jgi:hypothetical protein